MKKYYVYYHPVEGKLSFCQNRLKIDAKSITDAKKKAEKKLGIFWVVEKVILIR